MTKKLLTTFNSTRDYHPTFQVGDKVRFTGTFLKATGQISGGEGRKTFRVVEPVDAEQASFCALGFVAVDEASYEDPNRPRCIAIKNLYKVGTLTHQNDP